MRFSPHPLEIVASRKNPALKYHSVAYAGVPFGATPVPNGLMSGIYMVLIGILLVKRFLAYFR
jgi:hypothetical protein